MLKDGLKQHEEPVLRTLAEGETHSEQEIKDHKEAIDKVDANMVDMNFSDAVLMIIQSKFKAFDFNEMAVLDPLVRKELVELADSLGVTD
jgi:hypothetical protein